jgi:sulfide:quinone oxidoreductase
VASHIAAAITGEGDTAANTGRGACYVEFGGGEVGRVDVVFFAESGPKAVFQQPSGDLAADKARFGAERRARWFGSD